MCTCAIVNPTAGNGRVRRLWPDLHARLRATVPNLSVEKTAAPIHATALTRAALRSGAECIVAVGGDGTLHEIVNGFFDQDGTPLAPASRLVPLPCGTGTDFWRSLDAEPSQNSVAPLRSERVRPVDLLRLAYTGPEGNRRHRFAVNIASIGLSSRVARAVNRSVFPLPFSRLHYLIALLWALVRHRPFPVECVVDGTPLDTSPVHVVAVANGHTFGSGIHIAPNAVIDDGHFDATVLHDTSVFTLLRHVSRFYDGTHLSLDGVTTHRGTRISLRAPGPEPAWLEADGELVGRLPATITVVPQAIRLQY